MRAFALLPALLLLFPLASADTARTVSSDYVGFGDPTFGSADVLPDCEHGIAGACFALQPDDSNVTLVLQDRFAPHVCAIVEFIDPTTPAAAYTGFCDSARLRVPHVFAFPNDTVEVHMTVLKVKIVPDELSPELPPTLGTVTAVFE